MNAPEPAAGTGQGLRLPSLVRLKQWSIVLLTLLLCVVSALEASSLSGWADNLLTYAAGVGLIACGMTFVMIAGGFDLSVASTTAVCSVVMVLVLQQLESWGAAMAVPIAVVATLGAGMVLGAVNGFFVAYVKVNPFVVTLSTLFVFRGIALLLTGGGQSQMVPLALSDAVGQVYWSGVTLPGLDLRLSTPFLIFTMVFLVGVYLLHFTRFGHYCFAIGGNESATWLAGIDTPRVKASTYALCGLTCALAGIVWVGTSSTAQAASYQGKEMIVIAAVIVGGTPLGGGRGSLLSTLVGLLMLCVIETLLTQYGVDDQYRKIVTGLIILAVVTVDVLLRRART